MPKVKAKKEKTEKKPLFTKKEKPEKEPEFYRSATNMPTRNYRVYYMTKAEKLSACLLAFAVGALVGYLFYGGMACDRYGEPTLLTYILNVVVSTIAGIAASVLYLPVRENQLCTKRQDMLRRQFRDMLEAISTSFGSGKNIRDAFLAVQKDMESQYEETAYIVQELQVINSGLNNGVNIELLLKDFGVRSACEEITDFADIFEICYRKGGNINQVVRSTFAILSDKMAITEEIQTIVSGSKNEQNVMLVMPVLLIAMIKFSSPDFAANFASPAGVIATTAAVVLFVISYLIGKKVLNIKI